MLKIVPIRELKNTASISKFVEDSNEPVFITKNGYGSMVIMSIDMYEKEFARNQVVRLVNESIDEYHKTDETIEGPLFISEMKSKPKK